MWIFMESAKITSLYKESYERLSKKADLLFSCAKPILSDSEVIAYFHDLLEQRKKITCLLSETIGWICAECKGDCCRKTSNGRPYISIAGEEVLLYGFFNGKFPEPDYDFLIKENQGQTRRYTCLFLSRNGCLFGKFRPLICLRYLDDDCSRLGNCMAVLDQNKITEIKTLLEQYELTFDRKQPRQLISFLDKQPQKKF